MQVHRKIKFFSWKHNKRHREKCKKNMYSNQQIFKEKTLTNSVSNFLIVAILLDDQSI